MTNTFWTSDTHWSHKNIIKYSNRPFKHVDEMDEELIKRHNNKVGKDDIVFHMGDLSFGDPQKTRNILRRLNGKIRFFLGNHDKWLVSYDENKGWIPKEKHLDIINMFDWFKPFAFHEMKHEGEHLIMCHYAFDVWNKSHYNSWMIHGHSHGSLPPEGRLRMDVGVDCHPNYEPFSWYEIRDNFKGKKSITRDHHKARR